MMLMHLLPLKVGFDHSYECILAFFEPLNESLTRVLREVFALYDEIMKIVPEILGANMSSVSIKNTKEAYLRPFTLPLLIFGL